MRLVNGFIFSLRLLEFIYDCIIIITNTFTYYALYKVQYYIIIMIFLLKQKIYAQVEIKE